jgi:hypothetical protein
VFRHLLYHPVQSHILATTCLLIMLNMLAKSPVRGHVGHAAARPLFGQLALQRQVCARRSPRAPSAADADADGTSTSGSGKEVYQGVYGPWTVEREDEVEVLW